jgi:hypothetical protein
MPPNFNFKAMPPQFTLKFFDKDKKSFSLRLFQNSVRDGKGTWTLRAGKIKVPNGNWKFMDTGLVWFWDTEHIDFEPAVGLSARDVVKTKDTLNTKGTAFLQEQWALGPSAGATSAGELTWNLFL